MDNFELRKLAGLTTEKQTLAEEKKAKGAAKTKYAEGTFTKKAKAVVAELLRVNDGDIDKSLKALDFYMNRAGDKLTNADELEKAKAALLKKVQKESVNRIRMLSGLSRLTEEDDEVNDEEVVDPEEDELADTLGKIADKLLTLGSDDREKFIDLLKSVYQAGVDDASEDEHAEDEVTEDAMSDWQANRAKQAAEMNASTDRDAARKTYGGVTAHPAVPSVNEIKDHIFSVHDTQEAAVAAAKKLNDEADAANKPGTQGKFNTAVVVHNVASFK